MKRILLSTLLALPLAITSFASQASAAEVIVRPDVHRGAVVNRPVVLPPGVKPPGVKPPIVNRRVVRQRLIPAHWETTRNRRRWVPARYVRY